MTDEEIEKRFEERGYIVLSKDDENSLLISQDYIKELVNNGKAFWLKR